jgi:predicted nucleic acid-binding protein
MRQHVLDANALLRLILNEDGADMVVEVFKQAHATDTPVMMSVVNWGEVYYTLAKRIGFLRTEQILSATQAKTGLSLVRVGPESIPKVARLKIQYNLHYSDCFAAELAGNQRVLVTADAKDFERISKLRLLKLPPHRPQLQ